MSNSTHQFSPFVLTLVAGFCLNSAVAWAGPAASRFDEAAEAYDRSFDDYYKGIKAAPKSSAAEYSKVLEKTVIPAEEAYVQALVNKATQYIKQEFGILARYIDTDKSPPDVEDAPVDSTPEEPLKPGEKEIALEDIIGGTDGPNAVTPGALPKSSVSDSVVVEGDQRGKEYKYPGKAQPAKKK